MLDAEFLYNTVFVVWSHVIVVAGFNKEAHCHTRVVGSNLVNFIVQQLKFQSSAFERNQNLFVAEKMQRMCFKVPTRTDRQHTWIFSVSYILVV